MGTNGLDFEDSIVVTDIPESLNITAVVNLWGTIALQVLELIVPVDNQSKLFESCRVNNLSPIALTYNSYFLNLDSTFSITFF